MRVFEPLPAEIESLAKQTVDASLKVHRALGGLLESVYGRCLSYELRKRGLKVETQVLLPVVYDGVYLEAGLRLDFLIDKQLIVEVKAVQQMTPLFKAQVLTYLKLANLRLVLLINFKALLQKSIFRVREAD